MSACPNSFADGCRCVEHAEGLLAHCPDRARYQAALDKLRPVLRVVTMPTELEDPCTGHMTCDCNRCVQERIALMRQGSRDRPQPWTARKAA